MSRKHLLYLLVTGLVLLVAPFFIFLWTGIAETGIISIVGFFLCLGTSDALWGTKGVAAVMGVFVGSGLLFWGHITAWGLPTIFSYPVHLGILYIHVGYWILIAIAVIATKTIYQKKTSSSPENEGLSPRGGQPPGDRGPPPPPKNEGFSFR